MTRALTTLLLTEREIARLIDMRTAIRVTREAFTALARGEAVMPAPVYLPLPHQSDFRAMPAYLRRPNACGIKWVNVHPHNRARGLPTVMAVIVLNDPATGVPLAIMDGLLITKWRTAAAGAVAAHRPIPNSLHSRRCSHSRTCTCGAMGVERRSGFAIRCGE